MTDRDYGDESGELCDCCGGLRSKCSMTPSGCVPRNDDPLPFDPSPLVPNATADAMRRLLAMPTDPWPSAEERSEYETWSAIVALKNIRPDFLKPEALQWLKERE